MAVKVGVAADESSDVSEFVQNGGEEVVMSVGGGAWGRLEGGFCSLSGEFGVFPGGVVDEPA